MKALRFFSCLLLFANFSFVADNGKQPLSDCTVTVKANDEKGIVSPNIMGFNIVYCYESDAGWGSGKGKVSELVKALGTKQLRYPGGTVVTKYHWEHPTGQGWSDTWSPDFNPAKNTDPSVFMDIDEYLGVVEKQKIEPLVGINMGSGMKYNRVQDGVDEAVRLMKHCLAKGVKVKYYYLDNEPYQPDANFTYTPEQYAEAINTYVPAMKKVDPDIKIIANTHPNADLYTKALLANAGENIDYVDVHMYWRYKSATYENWKKEGLMKHRGVSPYNQQNAIFQKIFDAAGYPNIKLVILEWNIGPPGDNNIAPTEAEGALMVSEQFTQFIQSGLFMSTFWPLSWPNQSFRALLNVNAEYKPFKMYDMFALYKDVLGQQKVKSTGTIANLVNLAVKSKDEKTMWVYLINKQQDRPELKVDLALEGLNPKSVSSSAFNASDSSVGGLDVHSLKLDRVGANRYTLQVPRNSFVKLTFNM
ncbi:MAG: hypothetical protein K0S09_688 [Sphingobacteriaceae bacterium]|jgi:alpha-L-arabinofuranosidase|nr:hypothetical protein [Sphingobacteriaceae bacterium]